MRKMKLIWMALALAVWCCSTSVFADHPKEPAWEAIWQWEGEKLPPVLKVTIGNPTDTPLELKDWQITGKAADQFAFLDNEPPKPTTLGPGELLEIKMVWNGKHPPGKDFNPSLSFAHDRPGYKSPHKVPLRRPAFLLPFKYRLKGFLERQNQPVPRDDQGRIVTVDGYHDGPMVERLLAAFAEDYPKLATLHEIGTTWQGRKILALRITSSKKHEREKPAVLLVAAHHANELLTTEIVLDAISRLTAGYANDPEIRRWVDQYEIWCIPLANPDGLHNFFHVTGSGRKNGRDTNDNGRIDSRDGIDLNRNYPFRWHSLGEKGSSGKPDHGRYRGPSAGSEPETKAIMALADRERFVMLITYHTSGSRILVPYTIDGARNPHPDAAWIIGATMAALSDAVRTNRDYMPVRKLYSVDGVDQDWHYWRHGTLAYLWEGPLSTPPRKEREKMLAGARPGWEYLLRRLMSGPTISGYVFDARTRRPLEAVVSIDEIKTFEKERHTSHPDTGRFDRLLPIEGTYHVRVECEGYRPRVVEVPLGHQWKTIHVGLTPE